MTQFSRYISLSFAFVFNFSLSHCQDWTKQKLQSKDTEFAIYSWEAHDEYHSAYGEIFLLKNGQFKYFSHYPLNTNEFSVGNYIIHKDTLLLTSDFQKNNMKVDISYIDSSTTDTSYTRLSFPRNQKGKILFNAYYFLNNDTSFKSHLDPKLPYNKELLNSITSLMVRFYDMDCGSDWIPISTSNKFINVTMMTDKNLDGESLYKVMNWKFKMSSDKLIAVTDNK